MNDPRRRGLVVLVVILAILADLQWRRANDLASKAHARREMSVTAGRLADALLSYDFNHVADARARVLQLATGDFKRSYEEAFAKALQGLITELHATATATIRDVYVTEVSHGRGRAVVVLDSEVRSSAGVKNLQGTLVQMDLRRVGGKWKVSRAEAVAASSEAVTPGPPTSTTVPPEPTTAP